MQKVFKMLTLILVLLVISLLILVHEWGHFFAARKLAIKVEEFGFGFPPRILSKKKNNIRYSLNLFPVGGFVKIFGEQGEGEGNPESFASRPVWQRGLVIGAGILMNAVLAWFFFSAGSAVGIPQASDENVAGIPVSIISVLPNSPAESAGLKSGDKILEMRSPEVSLRIETEKDVRDFVAAYRGEEIILEIKRAREVKEIKAVPRVKYPEGEGPLGIAIARLSVERTPFYLAPWQGLKILGRSVAATFGGLWLVGKDLLTTGKTQAEVSGPVGIFFFAESSRGLGFSYFLEFMGFLSVNLAILNFLPIPALDGGRLLFLALEKIRRKRIHPDTERFAHALGFAFLVLVMILVTYHDIARVF